MINPIDLWASSAACIAGSATAIRSNLLSRRLSLASVGVPLTRVRLTFVSIVLGMATVSIILDDGASTREAAVYSVFALQACVMLYNTLRDHGTKRQVEDRSGLVLGG